MPVSKRSRRRPLRTEENKQPISPKPRRVSLGTQEPFWGWTDLALYVVGMVLLVAGLYQIVLHFGLSAAAAGAITDVPGPLAILYVILRVHYRRSPWAALGWVLPRKRPDWALAATAGAGLGLLVMILENSARFQIHFHTAAETLLFGVVCAGLVEETIWRGAVLPVVLRHTTPFLAALLTGAAFSLEHGVFRGQWPSLSTFLTMTLTGTAYGLVRIHTQSTLTAALMHGCYNLTLFFWQGA
jgi:membrane protease YdiL (CAAX protease family)